MLTVVKHRIMAGGKFKHADKELFNKLILITLPFKRR